MAEWQPKTDSDKERVAKVIRLWSAGVKQKQIADQLGTNAVTVNRCLKWAMRTENPWVDLKRSIVHDNLPAVAREVFSGRSWGGLETILRRKHPHLQLVVVESDSFESFCAIAGKHITKILLQARNVGVTGGLTMWESIRTLDLPQEDGIRRCTVIPLCGEVLMRTHTPDVYLSASRVAAHLDKLLNGHEDKLAPTLMGIPAYIPSRFQVDEGRAPHSPQSTNDAQDPRSVLSFVEHVPGYREIFVEGKPSPLIDRLDAILTGCGVVPPDAKDASRLGIFLWERMMQEDERVSPEQLSEWIYGEIGGVILRRDKRLKDCDERMVSHLVNGWTGITESHLSRLAKQAACKPPPRGRQIPGVIVAAYGAIKAQCIWRIVSKQLVNTLVVDSTLATALEGLTERSVRRRRRLKS